MVSNKKPEKVKELVAILANNQAKQEAEKLARRLAKKCEYCGSRVTLHWRNRHIICNECLLQSDIGVVKRVPEDPQEDQVHCGTSPEKSLEPAVPCLRLGMLINDKRIRIGSITKRSRSARGAKRSLQWNMTDTTQSRNEPVGQQDNKLCNSARGVRCRKKKTLDLDYDPNYEQPDNDPMHMDNPTFDPNFHSNRSKPPRQTRKKRSR